MSTSGTQAAIGLIGLADQGLPMAIATAEADYSLLVWPGVPAHSMRWATSGTSAHSQSTGRSNESPTTKTSPQLDGNRSTSASTNQRACRGTIVAGSGFSFGQTNGRSGSRRGVAAWATLRK
jgi:hypothetical protein